MPASTFPDRRRGVPRGARLARACGAALLAAAWIASAPVLAQAERRWQPLARDDVHDPKSPALGVLQEPREALSRLPADTSGNQVDWIRALEGGHIDPRTNILPKTEIRLRDSEVLLNLRGSTAIVRFPHREHTLWLDCSNCHEQLFKSKAGANTYSMERILQGEQCGVCHGAVAFPLTECNRCHSVPRQNPAVASPGAKR